MGWLWQILIILKRVFLSLNIEPFVFLFVLGASLCEITDNQLIQDKYCLNNYNKSRRYCIELQGTTADGQQDETVNNILGDLANFTSYTIIMCTLPGVVFQLVIGSWIDKYIHARKIILCVAMLGYAGCYSLLLLNAIYFNWSVNNVLIANIPVTLVGGWSVVWMTCNSYISCNTPEQYRFIKFVAFQIAYSIAGPVGTYLGGWLLGSGNYQETGSLHNYEHVFLLSTGCSVGAFFCVLFIVNETRTNTKTTEVEVNLLKHDDKEMEQKDLVKEKFKLSKIFDWKNVRDMYETSVKVRPNSGRLQIWLLILCTCLLAMSNGEEFSLLFPYVEKVYGWDAKHFSEVKSLAAIVKTVAMALIPPFLSNYLKLNESVLGLISVIAILLGNLTIGIILSPIGLYLSFVFNAISGMSESAVFAILSKVVSETESGKIFSLLGAMVQLFPSLQALVYNTLFAHTIDWFPSLSFLLCATINIIPIVIFILFRLPRFRNFNNAQYVQL